MERNARVAEPDNYRPRTFAAKKGISRSKVFAAIRSGDLPAFKLDGCIIIRREDGERWFQDRLVPVTPVSAGGRRA